MHTPPTKQSVVAHSPELKVCPQFIKQQEEILDLQAWRKKQPAITNWLQLFVCD